MGVSSICGPDSQCDKQREHGLLITDRRAILKTGSDTAATDGI
jgi:hypothetical protein